MSTLLVDNYDSYTYNVFHLLAAVSGEEPIVIRNDEVSWRALARWDFDAIVLSPGPGRPERWHDFGVCADILRLCDTPVLGVCLGHQGIGQMLAGSVANAPVVMHGRLSTVRHDGTGLFAGIPQGFSVVRYHSLMVGAKLGAAGRVTAWTDEGIVMGVEHRRRPVWGVQFHPESIASEHGHQLVENFYSLARRQRRDRGAGARPRAPIPPRRRLPGCCAPPVPAARRQRLLERAVQGQPSAELLFERLFAASERAFWLDSADAPTRLAQRSFLGTSAGAGRHVLEYDVREKAVLSHAMRGTTRLQGSIFDVLDRELAERRLATTERESLPGGLIGGYVGYLGYECKADCGSRNEHRSPLPDAVLMFANRLVAIDHVAGVTRLLALSGSDAEDEDAEGWLTFAQAAVEKLIAHGPGEAELRAIAPGCAGTRSRRSSAGLCEEPERLTFRCGRGRERYLADIARCQAALAAGESYEICLTDQIHADPVADPFLLYRHLRRRNAAPFSAYLQLGSFAIASSSPERFLALDRERRLEARPIKGTTARCDDPHEDAAGRAALLEDEKTFAEHLMIVDLLRNDLGRVCELDSVRVPEFMVVEDYATVHQLISTITGRLDEEYTPTQCVRACFPGGSMTGAPKLRTMEIIDEIEREARGVYSGAIGYFGVEGSVDLSIVIRTVVARPEETTIGAGGAIVMQSDPAEEFEELLLKARAPMSAVARTLVGTDDPRAWRVEVDHEPATAGAR
ncbi:MAG TPA: aminodeoxychorismate synthase component I [Solirubrobacteraceae bacterium]